MVVYKKSKNNMMKDFGLVSIITPNFNCEKYIQETIESVQAQTYSNWEMLVVDDCSTDNSLRILEEISEKDNRVRILHNEHNLGAAVSRNYGIREAKGKWIAFLDSDDLWKSDKLERQLEFMVNNQYAASYTDSIYVDDSGTPNGIRETGPKKVGYNKLLLFNFLSTCSVMYDRDIVGLVQIPDLKKRNDYAMWLKVAKQTSFHLLNDSLTMYRIRTAGSLSNKSGGMMKRRSLIKDHFVMFRKNEGFSVVKSYIFVAVNIIGYVFKKIVYIKKYTNSTKSL